MNHQGVFLAIEGTDGSGKTTQVALLAKRLEQEGFRVGVIDTPRYEEPSSYFVKQYLNGAYGPLENVSAEQGALLYAVDRFDASFALRTMLKENDVVIANRYVGSNLAHQGAKLASPEERRAFYTWVLHLEYETFRIPKPLKNIILFVPADVGQKLVDQKDSRAYINGKKRDLHEQDLAHLTAASAAFRELAEWYTDFALLDCMENGALMPPERVHAKLWEAVQPYLPTRA